MAQVNFDDLEEQETTKVNLRPIWTIDLDDDGNEEAIRKWLNTEIQFLQQESIERMEEIKRHLSIYKNRNYDRRVAQSKATQLFSGSGKAQNIRRVVVNHAFDFVEQKISKLVKFKPAVAILPTNDEWEDRTSAKVAEKFWGHIKELQGFDAKNVDMARISRIAGESFLGILWNEDEGPEHPDSEKLNKNGDKFLTLKDENGAPAKDEAGNVIRIPLPIRVGDVCYEIFFPWQMFLQKKNSFDRVNYCFKMEVKSADEVRLDYPKSASKIKADKGQKIFDFERNEEIDLGHETIVWTFWHKATKQMPKGREIIFTKDVILSNDDLPYNHGRLPFVRLTDIEDPGERHGRSFLSNVRQLLSKINDMTTMIVRNHVLASHPKWFVPRGAVKIESLGNDVSIVQYQGQRPPVLAQSSPTPSELFNFRTTVKEDAQQIAGVFGVSRGEPPPGIKAGIALQFLEEQENQRENATIVGYNEYIRNVAQMTLDVASQYYETSDKRTLMVMGSDGSWMTDELDVEDLSKEFAIRIQNSSSLPESKAARLQSVIELAQTFPEMFPQEQVLEMLDFGNPQKFMDAGSAAVKKSQLEDEMILTQGKEMPPQEWEMHLEHWEVHSKTIQGPAFIKASKDNQQKLLDHLMAHEMFMVEHGLKDPAFNQRLLALKQFPLIFTPPAPPQPLPLEGEVDPLPEGGGELPPIGNIEAQQQGQAVPAAAEIEPGGPGGLPLQPSGAV